LIRKTIQRIPGFIPIATTNIKNNIKKNFWEEVIAYFPFTTILLLDISKRKTLTCMLNKISKTIQLERPQCYYYEWEAFIKYAVGMVSDGMIYIPSCIKIG
jgi:hypothetical protein